MDNVKFYLNNILFIIILIVAFFILTAGRAQFILGHLETIRNKCFGFFFAPLNIPRILKNCYRGNDKRRNCKLILSYFLTLILSIIVVFSVFSFLFDYLPGASNGSFRCDSAMYASVIFVAISRYLAIEEGRVVANYIGRLFWIVMVGVVLGVSTNWFFSKLNQVFEIFLSWTFLESGISYTDVLAENFSEFNFGLLSGLFCFALVEVIIHKKLHCEYSNDTVKTATVADVESHISRNYYRCNNRDQIRKICRDLTSKSENEIIWLIKTFDTKIFEDVLSEINYKIVILTADLNIYNWFKVKNNIYVDLNFVTLNNLFIGHGFLLSSEFVFLSCNTDGFSDYSEFPEIGFWSSDLSEVSKYHSHYKNIRNNITKISDSETPENNV